MLEWVDNMDKVKKNIDFIKEKGLKITPPRVAVFDVFFCSSKPLSAEDVIKKLKGKGINAVTIYRTINSFKEKKLLRQVDLRKTSVFYELNDNHHHHIVCIMCGDIEDFDVCIPKDLVEKVSLKSKKFKKINDHSLEFFGICKICLKK